MLQNSIRRAIFCLLVSLLFCVTAGMETVAVAQQGQQSGSGHQKAARGRTVDPATGKKVVKIAVISIRGKDKALEQWQPTADYLTEHIPEYTFVVEPYEWAEMREAVANGRADFIVTNPGMYVEFEAKYDVKRVATLVNVRMGKRLTAFGVVLFRRADRNDINSIKDIKGKRLAAVEESSWGDGR